MKRPTATAGRGSQRRPPGWGTPARRAATAAIPQHATAFFSSRSSVLLQECPTHEARSITALLLFFSDRYEPVLCYEPPVHIVQLDSRRSPSVIHLRIHRAYRAR